jgi:hypothetical protein
VHEEDTGGPHVSAERGISADDILALLGGRPGWRLEPSSTPGLEPMWCFVFNGRIEYSVSADQDSVHLYVMDTDQDLVFADGDALMAWLRTNRAEAVQDPVPTGTPKRRFRRFTDWS